ncbi:AtpZ/AtpI family protein [Faecalicatena contorta]|uniref:ATP synthase protein I n=1 Tax=Faecalicatena contorta TaxID=39482 RepID=A0A315ZPF3_9FIRM|nr:AtpZ/AtpI family protein [Faecalicatena contorta]PWJ47172.1 ATP synthase protein I [Faecalicatena contorta]SUQ16147.1 ATP synthase protein I [Faecalicatena contorta]
MSEQQDEDKEPKNHETLRALAYFSQIGITLAATILTGVLLGKFLDDLLGTTPWLLLVFSLLGVGAAIKSLFNTPKDKK